MITKTAATALAAQWRSAAVAALPAKLEQAIISGAIANQSPVPFNYAPATPAQVDAFVASTMVPAGWTNCVNDPTTFTLTVA